MGENQLSLLLRSWFGEDAGVPGTRYEVAFTKSETGWFAEPVAVAAPLRIVEPPAGDDSQFQSLPGFVELPSPRDKFTRLVPVYSLEAAAGLWGPENTPEEIGWAGISQTPIKPGMFIARVRGRSMEPKIRDGAWCLFRPCPAGSREGRIVLVQFNSFGQAEDGGRFTVKKYHSVKTIHDDGWKHEKIELLPLNRDYRAITVEADEAHDMIVVGEFISMVG